MSYPKKIIRLTPEAVPPDRMLVLMNAAELRQLIDEIFEQKLRARLPTVRAGGLLNAEQAAEFLGYSRDWVYKNWQKIGGKKIGGRGVRFDAADLETWIKSRNGA